MMVWHSWKYELEVFVPQSKHNSLENARTYNILFFGINFYISWFVYSETTCKVVARMCLPFSSKAAPVTHSVSSSYDLGRLPLPQLGYLLVGGQHAGWFREAGENS